MQACNRGGQTSWTQKLHMIIFRNSGAASTRGFDGARVSAHGFNTANSFTFIYTELYATRESQFGHVWPITYSYIVKR
jgi:hypothetical protein